MILCCGRGVQDIRSFSACFVSLERDQKINSHGVVRVVAGQRKDVGKHDANVDVTLSTGDRHLCWKLYTFIFNHSTTPMLSLATVFGVLFTLNTCDTKLVVGQ